MADVKRMTAPIMDISTSSSPICANWNATRLVWAAKLSSYWPREGMGSAYQILGIFLNAMDAKIGSSKEVHII